MSMTENVRAKAEEYRTKIRTRIEELRTGTSTGHSPLLGDMGLMKGMLATEIREKGVMTTVRDRISKIRGGGGIIGHHSSPGIGEKIAVEKDSGAIKFQRGRLAIEG